MSLKYLIRFANKMQEKYSNISSENFEEDLYNIPEDYEPEGLEEEILLKYGPKPSMQVLIDVLRQHGIKGHQFGHGIAVIDSSLEKKIIPANLNSVMNYLGY